MPSFDLNQPHPVPSPDLILNSVDFMDCHELYGISPSGKNFIAYLQETDDVEPLGNWTCRIARRDFDAYGFDLARDRGLSIGAYVQHEDRIVLGLLDAAP